MDLINPAAVVDAQPLNSGKKFKEQIRIVKEVMRSRRVSSDIERMVKGRSHDRGIEEGNQASASMAIITDPCLGWEDSRI